MKTSIARIFHRVPVDVVRREQLFEAERLHVEHQAAAEMHAALSAVYRLRTERLRQELHPVPPTLTRVKP
jgi:hypothetical protein